MGDMQSRDGRIRVCLVLSIGFFLVSATLPIVGGFESSDEGVESPTALDRYLTLQQMQRDMNEQEGLDSLSASDDGIGYESGPYLTANADGSLPGIDSASVTELMNRPPYFIGWGLEATSASDHYVVGYGHEQHFGDLNHDGLLTWVVFYFDMGLSVNGVDDDDDGCVDETANMTSDGKLCDNVPDAVVFFSNGGLPSISGSLVAFVDYYVDGGIKLFRIGASPLWMAQGVRDAVGHFYIEAVGEFVSYYEHESINKVSVNKAIGDRDYSDYFMGIIDARGFPARPPKNHYCRTGYNYGYGYTYERKDGSAIVAFELREDYDEAPGYDNDYNDDGDTSDSVIGYFIVESNSGRCKRFVNTGVASGPHPTVAGDVVTSDYVSESSDQRDWNDDGRMFSYVTVWHDVTSTEDLAGKPYFGYTFKAPVPRGLSRQHDSYGFGFTGVTVDDLVPHPGPFPMEFGGAYYLYTGSPSYWSTYYWHIVDEDWDQWTELPRHFVVEGQPFDAPGGNCIGIYGRADFDGDGEIDPAAGVFCPDPDVSGSGKWEVEPASSDPPWFPFGHVWYFSSGGTNLITLPYWLEGEWIPPGGADSVNEHVSGNWHFNKVDPDFVILNAEWVGDGRVQLGGEISGYIDVKNVEQLNILCHARLDNDMGWQMRYDGCVENTERDGILRSSETARIHFAILIPDKEKTGGYTLTINLTLQRVTRSIQLDIEVLK